VIFGAGAIGGGIGGLMASAGGDVTLIARGPHLDAMRANGLILRTPAGDRTVKVTTAADVRAAEVGPSDVVILATKSQDTPAALAALAESAHPDLCWSAPRTGWTTNARRCEPLATSTACA